MRLAFELVDGVKQIALPNVGRHHSIPKFTLLCLFKLEHWSSPIPSAPLVLRSSNWDWNYTTGFLSSQLVYIYIYIYIYIHT